MQVMACILEDNRLCNAHLLEMQFANFTEALKVKTLASLFLLCRVAATDSQVLCALHIQYVVA